MVPIFVAAGYSAVVVAAAATGGLLPSPKTPGAKADLLAVAAGLMLGAAFFHMLPEALEGTASLALTLVPLGFFFLFALERTVLVHACEEPPDCRQHHGSTLGLAALVGLSVHTVFDGVALGSAVVQGVGETTLIAITAHKIPSSLSLAAILRAEGRSSRSVLASVTLLGLMVPLGVGAYFALDAAIGLTRLAPKALAFSVGTFLYVAVSDLLPHSSRHGDGARSRQLLLLAAGLATMLFLSRALPHG